MTITRETWNRYVKKLAAIDERAGRAMAQYIKKVGLENTQALIEYAAALVNKYGEASASLAAQCYDELAAAAGVAVPAAEPAATATIQEVAKGIMANRASAALLEQVTRRMVKQAAADTTLQNASRDGTQFAWIPNGDTCAFCIALASRGWQHTNAKQAMKGGHAEHIHANCDCNYAVRFNEGDDIGGYDPQAYLDEYNGAEGWNSFKKINAMRRERYKKNADRINEQKRAAYAARKEEP